MCSVISYKLICSVSLFEIEAGSSCKKIGASLCSFCQRNVTKRRASVDLNPFSKSIRLPFLADLNPVLKKIPMVPQVVDRSFLNENAQDIREKKTRVFRIASFVTERFYQDQCIICECNQEVNVDHSLSDCPFMQERCLRCCGDNHKASDCTIQVKCVNVHFIFGLPYENLGNILFHRGDECSTLAGDRLIPFLMYQFQTNRALVENKADMEFYSTQHFYQWIHDKQYGITHGMELIYRILVQE